MDRGPAPNSHAEVSEKGAVQKLHCTSRHMSLSFADLVIILNDDNDGEIRGRRDPSLCRAVSGLRDSTVIHAGLLHGGHQPRGLCHVGASHSPVSFFTMSISCTRDKISIKICSHLRMLLCSVTKSRSSPMNPPMPPPGLPVLQRRNGRRLFRPLMRASATYIPWYLFQPRALKHNQPSKPAQAHSPCRNQVISNVAAA